MEFAVPETITLPQITLEIGQKCTPFGALEELPQLKLPLFHQSICIVEVPISILGFNGHLKLEINDPISEHECVMLPCGPIGYRIDVKDGQMVYIEYPLHICTELNIKSIQDFEILSDYLLQIKTSHGTFVLGCQGEYGREVVQFELDRDGDALLINYEMYEVRNPDRIDSGVLPYDEVSLRTLTFELVRSKT